MLSQLALPKQGTGGIVFGQLHRPLTPAMNPAAGGRRCKSCDYEFRQSRSAFCQPCDRTFHADGDTCSAVCPGCGTHTDIVFQDEPMELCKHCLAKAVPELREDKVEASSRKQKDSRKCQDHMDEASSVNNLTELWRFMGCVCDNQEPDCFELQKSKWPKKSYYCLDCKQPYSAFLWSTELRNDQCPRCNGAHVETDKIDTGDDVIACLNCKSLVSKRRFDKVSQEVQEQCKVEQQDRQHDSGRCTVCQHCGSTEVRFAVTECDENPCVMQICDRCCSADFLAGWNRTSDRLGITRETERNGPSNEEQRTATPEGFEELTQCCGDLASLHPVEDDPDDDMLVCAGCHSLVSLRACKHPRIPMTVTALRRALKGTFSSGKMGRPYRTVKVSSLKELKPADQLDFKKWLYSHHAIVEKPLPESEEVQVIEYTGESNRPTILAVMRLLPTKACVQKSLLKFREKMQIMHRVDYHSLDCLHPNAVLRRAAARIGEAKYNLIDSNCEHFSNWAKANINFSRQVEAFKDAAKSALRCAVVEITDFMDDLPEDSSVRAAVTILQDIRAEMLRVLDPKNNTASIQGFWCPVRLLIKWAIRGIPLAFSNMLSKTAGCQIMWNLDGLLKPLSEAVAGSLLPDDKDRKEDKEKD